MKQLILINGAMGAGKSTVAGELAKLMAPSVFLDGDWCWMMYPFVVNEENKQMVIDNITHLLSAYLRNHNFEAVIFCWVMHTEEIVRRILEPLTGLPFALHRFTLTCTPEALTAHLQRDIERGLREQDVIARSLEKLPLYDEMDTIKIDTSMQSARAAAEQIARLVRAKGEQT